MSAREDVTVQTAIRRKMLENGYVPLANREKMCLLRGWSRLVVDELLIDDWDGMLAYQTTGLRIDAPLVAIDIDIDDAEIIRELWSWAVDTWGDDWADGVMIRRGSGVKECWVCRIDEAFMVPPGSKFVRPDEDPEDPEIDTHKVELFGGVSGRQIGAYGVHTPGRIWYGWLDDIGPAERPLAELPVLTKEQVFSIYVKYADLLTAHGWHRVRGYKPEEWQNVGKVYDVQPGTRVLTQRGVECAFEELREGDRVRMLEIAGNGMNTSRGLVHETPDGPAVWDAETGQTHMLVSAEPRDLETTIALLGSKLRERLGESKLAELMPQEREERHGIQRTQRREDWTPDAFVTGETWDDLHQIVANLQQRYAFFPSGNKNEAVVDMFDGTPYRYEAFLMMYSYLSMTLPTGEKYAVGERAGEDKVKRYNPAQFWIESPDTTKIDGYRFSPESEDRLVLDEDGRQMLNVYIAPDFGGFAPVPAEDWFNAFFTYLIPGDDERAWLLNWVAHKVQHPNERGVGVVLATPAFGTGRNVFLKMLREVLGPKWCKDISAGVLLGTSAQSQYDDGLANAVLVTCDEIAMEGSSFDAKMRAYERLKSVVDPYPQLRSINRKGLSPITDYFRFSAVLATNNLDAIPLPKDDRRLAVLDCTREPFGEGRRSDIAEIVDAVLPMGKRPNAAAMAGLRDYLMSLETDPKGFYRVPATEARDLMVLDNEGDVEETIRQYVEKLPDDQMCFWFDDLVRRGMEWLHDRPMVRQHFKRNARKLLRKGYAGWDYPNTPVRVTNPSTGESRITKGVVRRTGENISAKEYGRILCDR